MLRFVQLFRGVAIIFETIERHWISTISKNPLFTFKKINLHPNISCFVMEIEYKNLCKNNLFILLFNEIHYQKWKMSGNIAFKTLSKLLPFQQTLGGQQCLGLFYLIKLIN